MYCTYEIFQQTHANIVHCSIIESTNYASLDEADTTQPSNLQYQTNPSTSGRLLFVILPCMLLYSRLYSRQV